MWGCNFYSDVPLIGSFFRYGVFSLFFWGIIILITFFIIIKAIKSAKHENNPLVGDRQDSFDLLKVRYAKGDINSEEFKRMKQILSSVAQ